MILVIICGYSFLGNAALLGPGPYLTLWSQLFNISPADASSLISYPNLAYGFSSFFLVPLYLKIGRRPVMLGSMLAVSPVDVTPRSLTDLVYIVHCWPSWLFTG